MAEQTINPYLTFSSLSSFTLNVVNNTRYWDGTLEYSTDLSTWTLWDGTITISAQSDGTKYNLYMRGSGNTKITGNNASFLTAHWVLTGSNISCDGNIENLLDYQTVALGNHPTMASYCYSWMFLNCSSLMTAPKLPATTLTEYCYSNMFYGCASLTTTPELSVTTMASHCYNGMFRGCTSLITPPELPATTLASYCYSSMFYGCTSLTTTPELPVTTLAERCYQQMFYGCTSLTILPTLPATTLTSYCYNGMFDHCTNIKLSETQIDNYTKPYRIPTVGTGTSASSALTYMFRGTSGTFTGTPIINTIYYLWEEPQIESISSFNELEVIDHTEYITLRVQDVTINVAKQTTPAEWDGTDLTGTSWELTGFEYDVYNTDSWYYSINFNSNKILFEGIGFDYSYMPPDPPHFPGDAVGSLEYYGSNNVVVSNIDLSSDGYASVDSDYQIIEITGGTDATNQDLIDWLQANATLISW